MTNTMECRPACGACCTAISISSPIPGMPNGKPAGIRCVNLLEDARCGIFGQPHRPTVCGSFQASRDVCGDSTAEAFVLIRAMETATAP